MVPHSSICANSKSAEFANSLDFPFQGGQASTNSVRHKPLKRHLQPAMAACTHPGGRTIFASTQMLLGSRRAIHPQRQEQTTELPKFYTCLYPASHLAVLGFAKRFLARNVYKTYAL